MLSLATTNIERILDEFFKIEFSNQHIVVKQENSIQIQQTYNVTKPR